MITHSFKLKQFHSEKQNKGNILILYYKKSNITRLTWYKVPIVALVGGITLLTKKNNASSGRRCTRLRIKK